MKFSFLPIVLTLISMVFFIFYFSSWKFRAALLEMRANVVNQEKILSKAGIDDFFAGLKTIQFEELEKDFLQYSFSDVEKYKSIVRNLEYTIVPRSSLYQFNFGMPQKILQIKRMSSRQKTQSYP